MSDSSLLELLSVTDKAVKALNKSHSLHSNQSLESSVESTRSQSVDNCIKSQKENKKEEHNCYLSDVSTTASDVLIRSTLIDDEGKQHLSSSLVAVRGGKNESKCSKTSIGIDNFNSSGPQKVKMSTKKLREIRSPCEDEPNTPFSNISSQTVNSLTNECLEIYSDAKAKPYVTRHFKEINSQLHIPIKDSSIKDEIFSYWSEKNTPNLDIILQSDSLVTSDETEQRQFEYENSILLSSKNSSEDSEVLIERHTPKVTRAIKNNLVGNKEGLQMRPKQLESKDSIDLIPHKELESVNCSFSNSEKIEIITVPERIVTVSARTSLSTELSYKEKEDIMIPPRLSSESQPAKKVSNHLLRQGAPVEGMELQDRKKLSSDVQISQSAVFDREKIKEALAKRHENSGPVKRVIQPKFVKHKGTDSTETNQTDTVTASVAASVAMAATAPFLKAQQELENRMKDMLSKIAEIQNSRKVNTSVEDDRVKELERQVTSLTEQRIQHLEKLQEHQAELQAKMLLMTRSAPKRGGASPETHLHTPVIYRKQGISSFRPKKDFDQSSSRTKSTSPARPKTTSPARSNHSKWVTDDPRESPFDTPNPRSKAPKPVAFNSSRIKKQDNELIKNNHTSMGILEEILASSESPRQTFASPQLPMLQADIDEHLSKSPELRKAEKLVGDLSGINDDVKSLVHIDTEKDLLLGPSPLDLYLITSSLKNISTPYKSVPELSFHHFNAPLLPGFNEAEQVLQDVSKARNCLEANLQSVLRSQQEYEVYTILENLHQNRSDPERAHLKQKIDKLVTKLRQQVEREITDDVVVAEIQKAHLPIYRIPPPPVVSTQIVQGREKLGVTKTVSGRAKHGARINLGVGRRQPGNENKQDVVKPIKKDSRNLYEDEDFMNRVYGKTRFQGKRTIAKDPYLHFKTEPKQKVEQPQGMTYTKGHTVRSTKSQTSVGIKQFYFNPTHGTYIPVNTNVTSGPIPGSLIPMAIPLGGPRMEGGLTAPVTMATQGGLITSTPVSKIQVTAEKNFALITIPAKENITNQRRAQELSKQVLPNVDIDTDLSEMSDKHMHKISVPTSPRSEQSNFRRPSPTRSEKQTDLTNKRSEQLLDRSNYIQSLHYSPKDKYQDTNKDEDLTELSEVVYDEDFSPESAPGIELPGYNEPSPPTQRESFQPDISGHNRVIWVSDQIAEDIKRQEALENKAVEWVEQELMAKVISQMSTKRTIETPHISHFVEEVEESVCSDHENSMFLMEALGHKGLQLFIDAGQPVDMSLVNSLVKECVLEKVFSLLGKKSDDAQTGMAHTEIRISTASSTEHEQIRGLQKDEFDNRHVNTPKPTPKSSPIMSPVQMKLPPSTPPNSPPIGQEIYDIKKFEVIKPEYESELSESIDISEEMRQLQGKLSRPEEKVMTQEIHTVDTPVTTPVPEEDIFKEQRSMSPLPSTPSKERKEFVIPSVQAQGTEVTDECTQMPETAAEMKESAVETVLPEPWGDPYLPIPEENPDFEMEFVDHPIPITLCSAPADDMVGTQSLISVPRSGSPKTITPNGQSSPVPSDDSTTLQSSVSDTFNQSVSMGQWLLSKSEGEVADYILDDDLRQRIAKSTKHRGDCSIADTLKDTTELVDESMEPFSEGEFQYRTDLSPEKDPLLNFIASLQKTPLQGQFAMPEDHVHQILNQSGKSIGEITMVGQSGDQPSRDQISLSPMYRDTNSRISTFDLEQKNQSLEQREKRSQRDGNRFPTQILKRNVYSPTKEMSHELYYSNGFLNQDLSMQDSAVINDQKRSSVEFNDKPEILSGRRQQDKHHIPSGGITVTQGGLMPGGRSALKSAMRKPPQIKQSVEQPDRSVGMNQYNAIHVRSSDKDIKDSFEGSQDQLSSHAYTPDQMRLDTLVQSGYLTQSLTYSGELIQSGQSIDRSTYRDSSEYRYMNPSRTERGQSLGLTYSFEEEDNYKKSDNIEEPVKLKMSVTLPTTEDSNDGSQLSEIDITDRNTK
ncbi:TALPID3 protein-like isoform X2 [Mytilus californianus]|uniref:TALPID3 protein-like isoform X2 n=1 Tax=Mytilus californianus TaxID=6549 RepID=UPI002246E86E|nr:TALPID3 protein-like isoform X2 [Mytilus californianus]